MPGRSIDDQLDRIAALAKGAPVPEALAELTEALAGRSNILVASVAKAIGTLRAKPLAPQLAAEFVRFLPSGTDKACLAKTAIVKALVAIEVEDEPTFFAGASHVQPEPSYGGSGDAAVELRCESVSALVRMNSRKMWTPLVNLLADEDSQARATAARALGATGHDQAALLLRFKIKIGDPEPAVMGECFGSVVRLTRSIELVEPFLDSTRPGIFEAAALVLGESRLPVAWEALRSRAERSFTPDRRRVMFLAIAMTRQPAAIDFLLERLESSPKSFDDVLEALMLYRSDPVIRAGIEAIVERSRPSKLSEVKSRLG